MRLFYVFVWARDVASVRLTLVTVTGGEGEHERLVSHLLAPANTYGSHGASESSNQQIREEECRGFTHITQIEPLFVLIYKMKLWFLENTSFIVIFSNYLDSLEAAFMKCIFTFQKMYYFSTWWVWKGGGKSTGNQISEWVEYTRSFTEQTSLHRFAPFGPNCNRITF